MPRLARSVRQLWERGQCHVTRSWVARKKMSPFFAYDANYLIDNKLGIIVDAEGTARQIAAKRPPSPRR